jgi:RNA polymerase sigma-70 factor (ECF subfamily)
MQTTKWIEAPAPCSWDMGSAVPSSPPALFPPVSRELFTVLFRAHEPTVRRMTRGAGIHLSDEDDVIQEVFLALHRAIGRGFNVAPLLTPWLKKTTYSKICDRRALARCGREVLTEKGEIDAEDGGPSPEANMMTIDARRMVLELLDELRDELRLVLVMSDADDMPMSEIAEILKIPEGTGYTRLRAARREFEAAWNRRREEQAPHAAALGIAPFLLLDARALFVAERSIPDVAQDLQDRAWSRLVDTLGPGLQGAAAIAAAGAAAAVASAAASGATATKGAAVLLTAKQIAIGVVLSVALGAVLHAVLRPANEAPALVAISPEAARAVAAALPPALVTETQTRAPVASATASAASLEADAGAPIVNEEAIEKAMLQRARSALARAALATDPKVRARELAVALSALNEHEKRRFKEPQFLDELADLQRQARLLQQARQIPDGGHP